MIFPLYSIRDVRTGFMQPTLDQNSASASRNFEHAVLQPSSLMNSHPKDYALYHVGDFNQETGEIIPCMPELIIDAYSIL